MTQALEALQRHYKGISMYLVKILHPIHYGHGRQLSSSEDCKNFAYSTYEISRIARDCFVP